MDTRRIVRPSEAMGKRFNAQVIERKKPASDFSPKVQNDIVYAFKYQRRDPRQIAGQLSEGSPVRVTVRAINEVLRRAIPDPTPPKSPAPVLRMPDRRAA